MVNLFENAYPLFYKFVLFFKCNIKFKWLLSYLIEFYQELKPNNIIY